MTEDRSKRRFLSVIFQGDILVKQRIFISDYFIDRYISKGNNGMFGLCDMYIKLY